MMKASLAAAAKAADLDKERQGGVGTQPVRSLPRKPGGRCCFPVAWAMLDMSQKMLRMTFDFCLKSSIQSSYTSFASSLHESAGTDGTERPIDKSLTLSTTVRTEYHGFVYPPSRVMKRNCLGLIFVKLAKPKNISNVISKIHKKKSNIIIQRIQQNPQTYVKKLGRIIFFSRAVFASFPPVYCATPPSLCGADQ